MTRLTRILTLHRSLINDEPPKDAKEWADHFAVNVRTVLRDLAFLRDEMKAPLRYDPSVGGYRYEDTKFPLMAEVKQPKWTRLLTLIHRICAEPGQTANQLAEATGRVDRTIFRDIAELEKAGFPIYNDNGYRFATDAFLPAINLTPSEMFSLFVAVRLLESQDEEMLGAEARRAMEKLLRGVRENRRPDLGALRDAVQVAEVYEDTGANLLGEMQSALSQGRQVIIDYQGMKDEKPEPRQLDPLGLFCFRQVWYLHAHDHNRNGLRNFRLSRIRRTQMTDIPVKMEAKMEIGQASYHKWDVEGDEKKTVEIKVSDSLARWLSENPAHPSQELQGNLVTYQVSNPKAMTRWVTSLYGLEVLKPQDLRDELAAVSRELIDLYGDGE